MDIITVLPDPISDVYDFSDHIPTPQELRNHGERYALELGHDQESARGFAAFFADLNAERKWSECMPKRRALKIEYPRHLEAEKLKNLHPSRRPIGVSL